MRDELGLGEAVSMALGGMIGGGIYAVLGVVTIAFVPQLVAKKPETALAIAANHFLGNTGRLVIAVSALISTASAINATLVSSALFARGMVVAGHLPGQLSSLLDGGSEPTVQTLLPLGVVTAAFTLLGSLQGITSFASLSFIVVFGSMCALALRHGGEAAISPVPPAIGAVGCLVFLPLLIYRLAARRPRVFESVLAIGVAVLLLKVLYSKRESIREGLSLERWRS